MKFPSVLLLLLGYMTLCYGQDVAPRAVPPLCAAVLCPAQNCPNPITPPGGCCPICSQAIEKPGRCPQFRIGHCAEICSSDRDCPRRQKCCSIGCGRDCVDPLPNNPDCRFAKCPLVGCQYGSYIPVGQCCPRCRSRPGNTGYGRRS